jgi:Fungalysin metallopeptidase (M36)/Fungalysin/Thermolysin Propeptide Motif
MSAGVAVTLAAMLGGTGKEADACPGAARRARTVGRAALAAGLLAVLVVPGSASAAPARAAAKLKAARAPASELKPVAAIQLPGGATAYRFQQRVSGVKVLDGQAVVSDPKGAPPNLVADSSQPGIDSPPSPRVGRAAAAEAALRSAGVRRLRADWSASLAIEPGEGGTLVWRVVIPSARPLADFEVLVDAASGRAVRTRDLLQQRRGHARLYNPNPVAQSRSQKGLRRDHRDRNTRRLTSLRRPVTLQNIRKRQRCLRGKWVHAKLGRSAREVCKRGLRWSGVKRRRNSFEALMTYFHIDRGQRYLQRLGFGAGTAQGINKRTQLALANAFSDDNSTYSPAIRRIEYGSGGVDDAEDADVILHEYGHAIQDDQVRWFGSGNQAGAIGEGFGDYWAAAMSSRSRGTSNRDNVCIFDWDGVSYGRFAPALNRKCGRRADRNETLSEAQAECGFAIHCVGEVWSSALWDLRGQIGRMAFDRILLASQFFYTTDEQFDEAVEALIAADQASTGGENQDEICAEMETQRGISVGDCP